MNLHSCLICMGSNFDRHPHMASARAALSEAFPDIRFGPELETEAIGSRFLSPFSNQLARFSTPLPAEEVRCLLKSIEKAHGRKPEDKAQGIVRLDIDLLMYDTTILKPEDMKRPFVADSYRSLFF